MLSSPGGRSAVSWPGLLEALELGRWTETGPDCELVSLQGSTVSQAVSSETVVVSQLGGAVCVEVLESLRRLLKPRLEQKSSMLKLQYNFLSPAGKAHCLVAVP